MSFRDVEELIIEGGVDVSYETIRRWVDNFGSTYAKRIKRRSDTPSPVWHVDEVYTKIIGKMVYFWRTIDDEGTVLDVVVQNRRNTKTAIRLLRKLFRNKEIKPERIFKDKLRSYGPALKELGMKRLQNVAGRKNNCAECSHAPSGDKNEILRSLDPYTRLKNCSQPTVNSTTSLSIDVIPSQEALSESSRLKLIQNEILSRRQFAIRSAPREK